MNAVTPIQPDSQGSIGNQGPQFESMGYVVGLDLGGTSLRLALADMTGAIAARWSVSTSGIQVPEAILALICKGVDALLDQLSISRTNLLAIAAGAPGITDVNRGIVIATSYLMGWKNVPFRSLLEQSLGIPAFIDNDVNMAALGEGFAGAGQGIDTYVFVAIGTGVGAGIVLKGQLFRGEGFTAGEIGYMLVPGTAVAPVERGQPGALESIVGGHGIESLWRSIWAPERTSLSRDLTATQIFDQAEEREPLATQTLALSATTLAYAIYNVSLVLDCSLFILGGSVGMHPALIRSAQGILDLRSVRVRSRLIPSSLGPNAQITGAICRAIDLAKHHRSIREN